jgi:hypothetical protein
MVWKGARIIRPMVSERHWKPRDYGSANWTITVMSSGSPLQRAHERLPRLAAGDEACQPAGVRCGSSTSSRRALSGCEVRQ